MAVELEQVIWSARKAFKSGKTWSYEFRKSQLEALARFIDDKYDEICDIIYEEMRKPKAEVEMLELVPVKAEIQRAIKKLNDWMKPEKLPLNILVFSDRALLHKDPLGVVLIIAPWNYPFLLTINVLWGAIAAGNCVVLKPSEISPHFSSFLAKCLPQYIDNECYKVVCSGVEGTKKLLTYKFDHIFATGSCAVGKHIMTAAAQNLTPVTLELGGKCPVYIDGSADMNMTAMRLVWGKLANAGQTCLSPDYVLCSKSVEDVLLKEIQNILNQYYGAKGQWKSPDMSRIVNKLHFDRLENLLSRTKGKILIGGKNDPADYFFSFTVVGRVGFDDVLMENEIFGPILPIVTCYGLNDAIAVINSRPKPLGAYVFTRDEDVSHKFRTYVLSGSLCVNDTLVQSGYDGLPFGGVGESGIGNYHGQYSFNTFSHTKAVVVRKMMRWVNVLEYFRFPPYDSADVSRRKFMTQAVLNVSNFNVPTQVLHSFLYVVLGFFLATFWYRMHE